MESTASTGSDSEHDSIFKLERKRGSRYTIVKRIGSTINMSEKTCAASLKAVKLREDLMKIADESMHEIVDEIKQGNFAKTMDILISHLTNRDSRLIELRRLA